MRFFFQSGPILKLLYRPNDSDRSFGLVLKTGVGSLGSPIEAPITMSAEFNFLRNGNPSFFLQFKPKFGDFSIRRSVNSKKIENVDVRSNNIVPKDEMVTEKKTGKVTWADLLLWEKAGKELFGGQVHARTVIPVLDKVVGKIGWSLKFPATEIDSQMGIMPYMVVSKLGIEINRNSRGNDGGDVAKACLALKKKLGNLELENESLWKELEEMKPENSAGKLVPAAGGRKVARLRRMIER